MTVRLDSLRVGAEFDASAYTTGAAQKVAADRSMISSAQQLAQSATVVDTKVSQSGDSLARLNRTYVEGYRNQERFEQGLRQISRQLDSGKTDIDGATRLLVGMGQKLGVTADASTLMAQGQIKLAAAVGAANAQIENQTLALVEQARAAQAAENSRQAAAANQNKVNGLLGVSVATPGGAQASASVFEAQFAHLEQIAGLKAAQIGQNFGADLDASLVAGVRKSARDAATVFEAELDHLDKIAALKAQQAGGYFQQDLNARFGIGRPVNSAQASAGVFANAGGNKLSGYQLQGFGYQANDVITMALLGAPVSQIAASQGGQILQTLQMGEGGISGSLTAIKGSATAAGSALVGMLGTTGLIATGFGAAAVAAGAFYLLTRDKTKDLNEALKDERQAVLDVANAFGLAKVNADAYNKSGGIFAAAAARKGQSDLSGAAHGEDLNVLDSLARFVVPGYHQAGHYEARSQFSAFDQPIRDYAKSVGAGTPDYDALARGVRDVVAQNPGLQQTGDKILDIAKAGHDAAGALKEAADTLARINSRAPSLTDAQLGQDYRDQNSAQIYWLEQQRQASLLDLNARSPEERRRAAMATEGARPSADNENNDVREFKIATAGALAYEQALKQIDEAQKQRAAALSQYVDGSDLGDLFGDAA